MSAWWHGRVRQVGGSSGVCVVLALSLCAGLVLAAMPAASGATAGSLPGVSSGPRPGPDILYAAAATAPQLTNAGIWTAPPILTSAGTAYRDGEFLYQDYLYDDHGAAEAADPQDPSAAGDTFSRPAGTYTYPAGPAYANNAADLVEFRAKPTAAYTAFRITLNTMTDPSLVAASIAIGGTDGASFPFPDGANVSAPAALFLTVHPSGSAMVADLVHAGTGAPVAGPSPSVSVDTYRHQIEVRVPHADWNPAGSVVRLAMGVGLWDSQAGRYLVPQATRDGAHPGGAGADPHPAAFFNVAFRGNGQEPMPDAHDPASTTTRPAWWRDQAQAQALAAHDISPFHADVSFPELAGGATDNSGVPASGPLDRILASHFQSAPGVDSSVSCFPASESGGSHCPGQYQGNLQPYAIYVPPGAAPAQGWGTTLLLHSLAANYNQYLGSRNQSQYSSRGPGSIVITPESRGPDGFYDGYAGADVFEAWADAARQYPLDPAWSVITGYSMGGYGTFKLAEQFPDLFARGQSTVGASADNNLVPSLRNIPIQMWNMATDELVPESSYLPTAQALDAAGYRYDLDIFAPGDHLTLAINDQFAPAAAFLGTAAVDRNPPHVTYVVDPALDYPQLGLVADHAYWLSGLTVRNTTPPVTGGHAEGTIDAVSHGSGTGDPPPSATQYGAGTLTGGTLPALAYTSRYKTWGAAPAAVTADRLDITAANVATVTVDPARARVDCNVVLDVHTDGPLTVNLAGCGRTLQYP
jgi:hypothetical protein